MAGDLIASIDKLGEAGWEAQGSEGKVLASIHPVSVEQSPAPLALSAEPGFLSCAKLQGVENIVHLFGQSVLGQHICQKLVCDIKNYL